MKRFLKKKWHGIPIGIVASIFLCTALVAATIVGVIQVVNQEITPVPIPSSISAPTVNLPNVQVGQFFPAQNYTVTVVVGTGDAGSWLHLTLVDAAGAYSSPPDMACFGVVLTSAAGDNPMGVALSISANTASWVTIASPSPIQLTAEGTYIFTEQIAGVAGMTPQSATVDINLSLQDTS